MQIALFITCLTDQFFPRAGEAVVRVLEHLGHRVSFPNMQTCCGQPMYNNGYHDQARALARRMVRVFEPYDLVVTPSASCAAMVRVHAIELFEAGSAEHAAAVALAGKTFEFAELLTDVLKVDVASLTGDAPAMSGNGAARVRVPAVVHESCHGRSLQLAGKHTSLLSGIAGLELKPTPTPEQCCGFGGTFAVKYPDISGLMVKDKVDGVRDAGAEAVVCSDAGCTMNIAGACRRAGVSARFVSLAEVLAEAMGLMTAPRRQSSDGDGESHARSDGLERAHAAAVQSGANTPTGAAAGPTAAADAPMPVSATAARSSSTASPLFPALPYDLKPAAARAARDVQLQQFVNSATRLKDTARTRTCDDTFAERYDALRRLAGEVKQHTLDHLDTYLDQFITNSEKAGCRVHFAPGADDANAICLEIARVHGVTRCVKSKSMVTEETHLLPALERAGIETIETDLGEFIIQLDGDAPSHIVTPMIHKNRASVARAFQRDLGSRYTEDPRELAMIAREHLRQKYREAHLGISGANFLIADTGSIVLCTNEGNADFCVAGPRVHVAFVGIEKVIPRLSDLPLFLKLLARSATAQPMTVYTTLITGPRRAGEHDGPDEVHIILLDNNRSKLLEDESRELLRCIRCGACLNACPVYRKLGGGHAYGSVYSGPIGAVLTPALKGVENYPDLPHASSLCGACFEACPVHIDIPKHLVRLREKMVKEHHTPWVERAAMNMWGWSMRSSMLYGMGAIGGRVAASLLASTEGVAERASRDGTEEVEGRDSSPRWITSAPGPVQNWTDVRDLPAPAERAFRHWWKTRNG